MGASIKPQALPSGEVGRRLLQFSSVIFLTEHYSTVLPRKLLMFHRNNVNVPRKLYSLVFLSDGEPLLFREVGEAMLEPKMFGIGKFGYQNQNKSMLIVPVHNYMYIYQNNNNCKQKWYNLTDGPLYITLCILIKSILVNHPFYNLSRSCNTSYIITLFKKGFI